MLTISFGNNKEDKCAGKITWYNSIKNPQFKTLVFNFNKLKYREEFEENFKIPDKIMKLRTYEMENAHSLHTYWDSSSDSDSDGPNSPRSFITLCATEGLIYDFSIKFPTLDEQKKILDALRQTQLFSKITIETLGMEFNKVWPSPTKVPIAFLYHNDKTTQKERENAFYLRIKR